MSKYLHGLIFLLFYQTTIAQENTENLIHSEIGIQVQVYPAGIIPTLNAVLPQSKSLSWNFRLGLNITDRKDFSPVNDHEEGKGYGGSIGLQKHFVLGKGEIRTGLSCDVWNMKIDWENNKDTPLITSGKSTTLVVQPWIHGGYFVRPNKSKLSLGAGFGLGREINVKTSGREVAQGWMGSLFFGVGYKLR